MPYLRSRIAFSISAWLRHANLYQSFRRPLSKWSDEEWSHRLVGLAAAAPERPTQPLVDVLRQAPHTHSPLITRAAARHGARGNDALRGAAAEKVKARYQEVVADGFKVAAVEALAWPEDEDGAILPMTTAMLKEAIPSNARGILIGAAAGVGRLAPAAAPMLIDASEYATVLTPNQKYHDDVSLRNQRPPNSTRLVRSPYGWL